MIDFLQNLKTRNEALFYYGLVCLGFSILFLVLTRITDTQVYGVQAVQVCFLNLFVLVGYGLVLLVFT
jgi:hypothetical protein